MNADGSNLVGLGMAGLDVKWSPDGERILFSDGTIQVMNADGSQVVSLTTSRRPDWSPDGTRIAFDRLDRSRCVADFCPAEIYLMAADGSQNHKLVSIISAFDELSALAWSPDGSRIAYLRHCCFCRLEPERGMGNHPNWCRGDTDRLVLSRRRAGLVTRRLSDCVLRQTTQRNL